MPWFNPLPAGLELLLNSCPPSAFQSRFSALVVPLHWSVIRVAKPSIRLLTENHGITECLPEEWTQSISRTSNNLVHSIELTYAYKLDNGRGAQVLDAKIVELENGEGASVTFQVEEKGGRTSSSSSSSFNAIYDEFLDHDGVFDGIKTVRGVYLVERLAELERIVAWKVGEVVGVQWNGELHLGNSGGRERQRRKKEKQFSCKKCGKLYYTQPPLLLHLKACPGKPSLVVSVPLPPPKYTFRCEVCGRGYFAEGPYKRHLTVKHNQPRTAPQSN